MSPNASHVACIELISSTVLMLGDELLRANEGAEVLRRQSEFAG